MTKTSKRSSTPEAFERDRFGQTVPKGTPMTNGTRPVEDKDVDSDQVRTPRSRR
jgi:hypothetical protein